MTEPPHRPPFGADVPAGLERVIAEQLGMPPYQSAAPHHAPRYASAAAPNPAYVPSAAKTPQAANSPKATNPPRAAPLDIALSNDPPTYRSRGEAAIAAALEQYGVPFRYEQPWLIHDRYHWRLWYPDFTLPGRGGQIIEYAGMPECPDYMRGVRRKQRIYADNGVRAVFVYPGDLRRYP